MLIQRRPTGIRGRSRVLCPVPPSPGLMAKLLERYHELVSQGRLPKAVTFKQFFDVWSANRRGEDFIGLDDGSLEHGPSVAVQKIQRPKKKLRGVIQTLVLLVEFPDQRHEKHNSPTHFRRMLFGLGSEFPTGSMR